MTGPIQRWSGPGSLRKIYLEAAFEEGDAPLIAAALGDMARARGMAEVARKAESGPGAGG
jgi:probable addiction module antidote protein